MCAFQLAVFYNSNVNSHLLERLSLKADIFAWVVLKAAPCKHWTQTRIAFLESGAKPVTLIITNHPVIWWSWRLQSDVDNELYISTWNRLIKCLPTLSIQCVCDVCICDCVWVDAIDVVCDVWMSDVSFIHETMNSTNLCVPAVVNSLKFRAITHGIHASPSLPPLTLSPHISTPKAMCECVKKPLPVFCLMVWLHSDSIFMSALFSHWFHINNFSANTHLWLNEH